MIENGDYKLTVERRLTIMEIKIDEVMMNHLPHIQKKVDQIQWLLITTLLGIIFILIDLLIKR